MLLAAKEMQRIANSAPQPTIPPRSYLGLSNDEIRSYSIAKAIKDQLEEGGRRWHGGTFESACHDSLMALGGCADHNGFLVPYEIQHRRCIDLTRVDTVGAGNAGGYLVGTQVVSFIDLLRYRTALFRLGAQELPISKGNVTIPRLTATANNYWLPAESTQINSGNSSNQKFSQMAFTPHNVGGYTEISRQLLVQSPKAADVVLNIDLPRGLAVSIDYAGINGNGSGGQPVGILSYQTQTAIPNPAPTGTTANTLSSNGASIAFADMVTFQENAGIANSDGASFGYVTNPATAALLKKRQQFTGASFTLWEQDIFFSTNVCGATGLATEQVASGTLIGGPWGDVMVAIWDDLEISIDPYSNFQAGIIGTRAFASVDIGFRAPAAWTFVSGVT